MVYSVAIDCSLSLTTAPVRQRGWACEKAASNLGKGVAFRRVLRFSMNNAEKVTILEIPNSLKSIRKNNKNMISGILFPFHLLFNDQKLFEVTFESKIYKENQEGQIKASLIQLNRHCIRIVSIDVKCYLESYERG